MFSKNQDRERIRIVYYTHPLCSESWQMQESWQRLLDEFGRQVSIHICIGDCPAALGSKPDAQRGPGPKSTRDIAGLAVKTASLQSQSAADLYLAALRKAAFADERDISKLDVLVDVAREVSKYHRHKFDLQRFGKDFDSRLSRQALFDDQQKIRLNNISTLPTLTFTVAGRGMKVTGFNSFEQLARIMGRLSPDLRPC